MKITTKNLCSLILAILMVVSVLPMSIFALDGSNFELVAGAVTVNGTADATVEVVLKVKISETITGIQGTFTENSEYITLDNLEFPVPLTGTNGANVATGSIIYVDDNLVGFNVEADDNVIVATYTVDKATPTGEYEIQFDMASVAGADLEPTSEHSYFTATISVTNTAGEEPAADYTANLAINGDGSNYEINVDDTVTVDVIVGGSAGSFATSQIELSYDPTYLTFDAENAAHVLNGASVSVDNDVITLIDHGASQENGTAYQLVFTGKEVTTEDTVVTLTSAAFDKAENAPTQNIPLIDLDETTNSVAIKVVEERFTVSLSDDFGTDDGQTVAPGGTFTFYAKNPNYTYTVTVNEGTITPTYNDATGVWTITDVQANLIITATKEAKKFKVTINSVDHVASHAGVGENAAMYDENRAKNYTFTLKDNTSDYKYNLVQITIGGENAPANAYYSNDGKAYTIYGDYITGDIVITTEEKEIEEFNIDITGTGLKADKDTVKEGDTVTLTLTPVAGYKYDITLNDNPIELKNNQYSAKVTEDWNVVVTTSLDLSEENVKIGVEDSATYLSLSGKTIYLIQITTVLDSGNVYTYGGESMYWSDMYNDTNGAYVYLVVAEQTLTLDAVIEKIQITSGSAKSIDYSGNVNMVDNSTIDANDAQLVYNMYETKAYDGFVTGVEMEKYLRADVNGDGVVNVADAAAIVNTILSAN